MQMQRYRMNPNYAKKVKEKFDVMLEARLIVEAKSNDYLLFSIVVVPKKNKKLRINVDFRNLNEQAIKDPFPIPFMDTMMDQVAGHETYSFLDGYNGFNQVV